MNGDANENLYLIKLTAINLKKEPAGSAQDVSIKGTFTSLPAAKAFCKTLLTSLGYDKEFFPTYDVRSEYAGDWPHGDGVQVYASVPDSEIFKVELETEPNKFGLKAEGEDGRILRELWHVLQVTIHYNIDRSGAKRDSTVEGSYETVQQARQAALAALLDEDVTKENFAEYDEFKDQKDWPYGEDVVVHAVGQSGENYLVKVLKTGGK